MVVLTVLMYSLSTTHISLSLRQNLIAFFDQKAANGGDTVLNKVSDPLVYTQIALEVINVSSAPCNPNVRALTVLPPWFQCLLGVRHLPASIPRASAYFLGRTRSFAGGRGFCGEGTTA